MFDTTPLGSALRVADEADAADRHGLPDGLTGRADGGKCRLPGPPVPSGASGGGIPPQAGAAESSCARAQEELGEPLEPQRKDRRILADTQPLPRRNRHNHGRDASKALDDAEDRPAGTGKHPARLLVRRPAERRQTRRRHRRLLDCQALVSLEQPAQPPNRAPVVRETLERVPLPIPLVPVSAQGTSTATDTGRFPPQASTRKVRANSIHAVTRRNAWSVWR
jgi:hypothetical protein